MTDDLTLFRENLFEVDRIIDEFRRNRRPLEFIYDSEEMRADALEKFWRVAGRYDLKRIDSFPGYVRVCVLRHLGRCFKRNYRRRKKESTLSSFCQETDQDGDSFKEKSNQMRELEDDSGLSKYIQEEDDSVRLSKILQIISRLSPKKRKILNMRFIEGRKLNDIARETDYEGDTADKAVLMVIKRTTDKIREEYENMERF
ncbi:MAG: hypothetical protein AABX23_03635 [Nanoarchaeota archaeon]